MWNPDQPRFFVWSEDGGNGGRRPAASGAQGASGCSGAARTGTQEHAHGRRIHGCNSAGRDNTNGRCGRNSRMNRIDVTPAGRRWPNLPGSEDPGSRGKRKGLGGFRDWCSRFPSCEGSEFALRAFTLLPPPRKIRDRTCDGRHRRQRRRLPGI